MKNHAVTARLMLAASAPKEIPASFQPAPEEVRPAQPAGYEDVKQIRLEMHSLRASFGKSTTLAGSLQLEMMADEAQRRYVKALASLGRKLKRKPEHLEQSFRDYEASLDKWQEGYHLQRLAQWSLQWADTIIRYADATR